MTRGAIKKVEIFSVRNLLLDTLLCKLVTEPGKELVLTVPESYIGAIITSS